MRALLVVMFCFIYSVSYAQYDTVVLKAGTKTYVTVDNANYVRGYLGSVYNFVGTDSTLAIRVNSGFPKVFISPQHYGYYKNFATGLPFTSMASLVTWMNTYFEDTVSAIDSNYFATGYDVDTAKENIRFHYDSVSRGTNVYSALLSTGDTVTLSNNSNNFLNSASSTLLNLVVKLPSAPVDGDVVTYKLHMAVTTMVFINGTLYTGTYTQLAGGIGKFTYRSSDGKWY